MWEAVSREGRSAGFWKLLCGVAFLSGLLAWSSVPAGAIETTLGGDPLTINGYLKQSATYGLGARNQIDSMGGFNSFVTEGMLEMRYEPRSDLKFFLSGKGNVDWAYPILAGSNQWKEKQFDQAYSKFFIFDDWQDILSEAHVTYAKNDWFLRAGKQVVVWGEADGFRLMDQINPIDQRRGVANVNFENVVIPVWLLRAEYRQPVLPSWIQDLTYQFVFNPNFQYRGNMGPAPGGPDTNGIWYMDKTAGSMRYVNFPLPPGRPVGWVPSYIVPYLPAPFRASAGPYTNSIIGSFDSNLEKPATFSSDGYKYAGRITTTVADTRISFNGFYGRDNNWVFATKGTPRFEISPFNGSVIVHSQAEMYYPLLKFVGATASRDLSFLRSEALGGVSPVVRLEAIYAFNSTFGKAPRDPSLPPTSFEQHDEVRWLVGVDWKVKIPALNEMSYFTISPQMYNRRIMNFKDDGILVASDDPYIRENTWMSTLNIMTSYFHNKLQPSLFIMRDWSNKGWLFKPEVAYEYDDHWKYTLGGIIIDGDKEGEGLWNLRHKNQIYGSVIYRF